jgi:hypothetical protein
MRRVLRPNGRVVLTTNGQAFMREFEAIHEESARALGYAPAASVGVRFTLADLDLVRQIFPDAERHVLDSALAFGEVESALRYYASGMIDRLADRPSDGSHRPRLLELVGSRINATIAAQATFRVSKSVGWFTADV